MGDFDMIIRGNVVLTDRIIEDGYVAVSGETIMAVGRGEPPAAGETYDARGAWIFPGAVDGQVHTRSQADNEGFDYATRAAAAGGVTTIVDMPYDEEFLVCSAEAVRRKVDIAEKDARVDFALFGTIDPKEGADRIAEMADAGVCAYKFSTFGTHPVRFPRIPPYQMYEAFKAVAATGLAAGVHNEDDEYVVHGIETVKAKGLTGPEAHGLSRPPLSEALAINDVYEIGVAAGCRAHVVHCSIGRGYEICEAYRRQGYDTTIECCIHYLILNEEDDVMRLGGFAKINPPIRKRAEMEAIWKHLEAGHITFVSTDHSAWSEDRKNDPNMLNNASGAPGLEYMLPLLIKGCLERDIELTWVSRLLASQPAEHFRLGPRKGALRVGNDADIAIVEPGEHVCDPSTSQTVVTWSPYAGMTLPGKVAATFVRGQMVWDGTKVIADRGYGTFIKPFGRA